MLQQMSDMVEKNVLITVLILFFQSQVQSKTKSVDVNDKDYTKDESQHNKPPKKSADVKMFVDSSIPFSVRQLHEIVKSQYSDFAFVYALSSQLCQERIPMECFVTLKIALLLSLVSIGVTIYSGFIFLFLKLLY